MQGTYVLLVSWLTLLGTRCAAAAGGGALSEVLADADGIQAWLVGVRRELHQWPELMFAEHNTSAYIARQLEELGVPYKCVALLSTSACGCRIRAWYQASAWTGIATWCTVWHLLPSLSSGWFHNTCACVRNTNTFQASAVNRNACAGASGARHPRPPSSPP